MHICFLCDEYPPTRHGGIGSLTQTLGRRLVAEGHGVTVVGFYALASRAVELDRGVTVIRLPHGRPRGVRILTKQSRLGAVLREIHRDSPIDVIDGCESAFAFVPTALAVPRLIRMNGGHHFFATTLGKRPKRFRSWIERRSFARATHLCAASRFVADSTCDLLDIPDREITVLFNPVDTDVFHDPVGMADDGLIVFAGTVCEKKGIRQLVLAMRDIVDGVPNARLVVAGRDWHDPDTGASFTAGLKAIIPAELASRITFLGALERDALPGLLARAAVCVYPSHMEALGIAIVEGLSMGKAVVASGTGPGPEIIDDGYSGLLCDPYSPTDIASKVVRVLRDPALRKRLGEGGRRRAVDTFSIDALIAANVRFYERCIGAPA